MIGLIDWLVDEWSLCLWRCLSLSIMSFNLMCESISCCFYLDPFEDSVWCVAFLSV